MRLHGEQQDSSSDDFHPSIRSRVAAVGLLTVTVALPILSTVFGLYDRILHWGKVVHGVEGLLVTLLVGVLLLAWRDHEHVDLSDHLATLMTMCVGIFEGLSWEIVDRKSV